MFENSNIVVTGGTGSFGQTFVPKTLEKYNPKKIIIFSRDEMKQWEMAKLYKDDDHRRDAGFSLFYAGVNLGALIGGYICIAVANGSLWASLVPAHLRWNVAFGFAAVVMIVSLLTFTQTQKSLGDIGLSPLKDTPSSKRKRLEVGTYIGSLLIIPVIMTMVSNTDYTDIFMFIIGPASLLYLFYEMRSFSKEENKKLLAALVFIIFSIFFKISESRTNNGTIGLSLFPISNPKSTSFCLK